MTFSATSLQSTLPQLPMNAPNRGMAVEKSTIRTPAVTFGSGDEFSAAIRPSGKILPVLNAEAAPPVLQEAVNDALENFGFPLIQDALREEGWKVVFAEFPDQYPGKLTRENAMAKTITVPVVQQDGEWLVPESLTCMYEGLAEAVDTSLGQRRPNLLGLLSGEAYVRQPLSTSDGFRLAVEKDCDGLSMVEKILHRNDRLHDVFRQELSDLFQYGLPGSDFLDGQELLALAAQLNGGGKELPPTRFPNARVYLTNALNADWFLKSWVASPLK